MLVGTVRVHGQDMESIYRETIESKVCLGSGLLDNIATPHCVLAREHGRIVTQESWRTCIKSPCSSI